MQPQTPDRVLRGFIVLVALLQGLALYGARLGADQQWWPLSELGGQVCWYTLVLSVPTVMTLTVQQLRDAHFWQHTLLIALIYGALAAWASWNASGAPALDSAAVLVPFGSTVAVALFELMPYLQCRLKHGRWTAPYPELFEHGWQNGLTLLLLIPFVALCWAVLWLWGALFKLVEIAFFAELFGERAFVYLATGTMVGLGILVARTQQRPVQILQQIVFAVFKGLLPLLAFIAVLFLTALPFTGLDPLWQTRRGASLLMTVVMLMVLFTNAVFQDGRAQPGGVATYPRILSRLVELGLATLPVYALLALYAVWLRVDQYGWTPDRLYAALLATTSAAYALGYSYSVLRPAGGWLSPITTINVSLSWLVMALIALLNSPVLDPFRISVASQLSRLHDGEIKPAEIDLKFLRFSAGRIGHKALQELQSDAAMTHDPAALAEVRKMLTRKERWQPMPGLRESTVSLSLEQARKRINAAPGADAVDDDWLQAIIDHRLSSMGCLEDDGACLVLSPDLDRDGVNERLLCETGDSGLVVCRLSARVAGKWADVGNAEAWGNSEQIVAALKQGKFTVKPRRWADLQIGDQTFSINER
ncbi:MAG: rane protein [Hydrocarboniphaga sp.]|uniref:DUF4153 domain-containing protein n=1 Tax=Hydrocarboniphaga sp. TaxID=2033016 RepID=UPI002605C95C|nr:DUF4153 domain-containing protein [Hydrocarboniphaga sp.]MDB5967566.1 rane protein [Hydrocarboniphaga sp.]